MDYEIYISHKRVKPIPMSKGKYNLYRGWTTPLDEEPTEEGYLVEYLDGGKPNDSRHEGYISWTPKAQFDNGYTGVESINKVEPSHIEQMVDSLSYQFERVGDTSTTGCWAYLPNGFMVGYGWSSCVDPANYEQALGEQYAKEMAVREAKDKLWMLEGYLLKTTGNVSKLTKV